MGHGKPSGELADIVLAACAMTSGGILRGFSEYAFPYTELSKVDHLLQVYVSVNVELLMIAGLDLLRVSLTLLLSCTSPGGTCYATLTPVGFAFPRILLLYLKYRLKDLQSFSPPYLTEMLDDMMEAIQLSWKRFRI